MASLKHITTWLLLLSVITLGSAISAKTALGGYQTSFDASMGEVAYNPLNQLGNYLDSSCPALGFCNGADRNLPKTTSTSTLPTKYQNRLDVQKRTASDVNSVDFDNGYKPPYKPGTQVTEFTTKVDDKFVRVHNVENPNRPWMMKKEAVEGLTAKQIQKKYSLPTTPSYISDVHVPSGTRMRTGKVESNFELQGGGGSGATQYEWISGRVPLTAIKNTRTLD